MRLELSGPPDKAVGTPDWEGAIPKKAFESEVLPDEWIKDTEWSDLVNEAVAVRKRKKRGEDCSTAWYRNTRIALESVPFEYKEATPQAIRSWVLSMQKEGLGS